jgi:predicted phage terminase large subunit-like protein
MPGSAITSGSGPSEAAVDAERAKRSLARFCELTGNWKLEAWQELVCKRLERLLGETGQRVCIHGPPQFGKSFIISQRFPAWALGQKPDLRFRLACYNETHADRFSTVNLDLMRSPEYRLVFPDPAVRVPKVCPSVEWYTALRASRNDAQPSMRALGLQSGFTGLGVDTLILDDPYKGRDEAFSDTINEGIWDWWKDVVLPRMNPDTNVVVMFHRWREDDLAGRLIKQGFESIRFPAIADGAPDDPTIAAGLRKTGQALTSRYPVPYLRQLEKDQGPTSFAALYQGRPFPEGGQLFKEWWFKDKYRELPKFRAVATFWDTALKDKEANDETACLTAGLGEDGRLYILRIVHGRWETPAMQKFLVAQARWLKGLYGDLYEGDYVEDKVSGTTLMQYVRISNPELVLIPIELTKADGDKTARARGVMPFCETGRVVLPDLAIFPDAREWFETWIGQLRAFPGAKLDDIVDVFVYAVKWVLGTLHRRKSRRGKGGMIG